MLVLCQAQGQPTPAFTVFTQIQCYRECKVGVGAKKEVIQRRLSCLTFWDSNEPFPLAWSLSSLPWLWVFGLAGRPGLDPLWTTHQRADYGQVAPLLKLHL